jgi:hypothetical protein
MHNEKHKKARTIRLMKTRANTRARKIIQGYQG